MTKAIKSAKKNSDQGLKHQSLDRRSLHMRVYSDASFTSKEDLSSQIGYIILLCDKTGEFNLLNYASRKFERVVQSIMSGELCAFTDSFDATFLLAADLRRMLKLDIPTNMMTDSKQVFEVISRGKRPAEKRLAIDSTVAREAYVSFEIGRVGLTRGEDYPADVFNKMKCNDALRKLLDTDIDSTSV